MRLISSNVGCAVRADSTPWCARRTLRGLAGTCLFAVASIVGAANLSTDLHRTWSVPRATEFADASRQLTLAIETLCTASSATAESALQNVRQHWLHSLFAWERLSAVNIGPVLERRSQRQIDFTPTRPRLIEKAVTSAPANAADMELIGTPAKGLPALEWLLWVKPIQPASAECRYALQAAAEVTREAEALQAAPTPSLDDAAALSEWVNQWVGGLERLRWSNLEMPARVAQTSGGKALADFPRGISGASAASWAAQWDALQRLAVGPVSLASILRQRGKDATADALAQAIRQADADLQGLTISDAPRIFAAAQQLAALKRLLENDVAPSLGVNIGFSDSDGD
jgi:predicted lipoprotein